ncbi:hypothetical protein DPMN_181190 [Dreissena polymorpha]|uniref:Uncharacterized protein n=2 Tax=Dreissena polymorpha TaxID=45954 RepID=A0A9D4DCD0_DREPO|nr:hypothetical protein DPMN_181190 [Dreissena polymorpha]
MTDSKLSTIEDLHNWIRTPKSVHIWGAASAPGKGTLIPGIFQTRNEDRIIIRDRRTDEPFAQSGDSGAMVCYFDPRKEELYVVAMLVGLMEPGDGSQNREYVAEILDVALQKLSLGNGCQLMLVKHDDL